jgi:arginyl-tRNA synthetase
LQLANFPEIVQKSAMEYKPNVIARFALNLSKQFATYYHQFKILDENAPELSIARLTLL